MGVRSAAGGLLECRVCGMRNPEGSRFCEICRIGFGVGDTTFVHVKWHRRRLFAALRRAERRRRASSAPTEEPSPPGS